MGCPCNKNVFLSVLLLTIILSSCSLVGKKSDQERATLFSRGQSFYLKKDFPAAISQFQEVIKIDPSYPPARIMLGKSLYFAGKPAESAQEFRKLLRKKPHSVTALVWLARIEGIDLDKKKEGLSYCDRALEIDPENYLAHFYRAILMEDSGMTKEAILSYSAAIDLENIVYLAHYKLGRLYQEKGLPDKALAEFKNALRYDLGKELESDVRKRIKFNESKL